MTTITIKTEKPLREEVIEHLRALFGADSVTVKQK